MTRRLKAMLIGIALSGLSWTMASVQAAPNRTPSRALHVPEVQVWTRNTIRYNCGKGGALTVRYINTRNEQSFALLSVKNKPLLFVNVAAASGAKYVAGQYVWWTKGPQGELRDALADEKSPPLLSDCKPGR